MVYDQLYMEYKLPEGINSTRVARDLEEIEAYLKKRPEITHVTTSIGGTPARYNLVRNIANPSLSYGELIIDFTSPDALVDNMAEIQQYLSSHYPDAYVIAVDIQLAHTPRYELRVLRPEVYDQYLFSHKCPLVSPMVVAAVTRRANSWASRA